MSVEWHKLGELIERLERPNSDGKFGVDDVRGVSNTKLIQKTKASMEGRNFRPFTVLNPREFIFNRRTTRNGERLGLGFNQDTRPFIFTEDYVAFRVKDECVLLPEFLYVLFLRDEFDRYVRWDSWGSATEFFNWENMCRVEIPVPSIEEQKKVVEVWQRLRKMKEENEKLAEPLMQLCRSYLQDCKKKYEMVEIGPLIEQRSEINKNGDYGEEDARGVNTSKEIQTCKRMGESLLGYKIVHPNDIVYNANIKLTKETTKFAVALYDGDAVGRDDPIAPKAGACGGGMGSCRPTGGVNVIVTNFYTVFCVKSNELLPAFLMLFLIQDEFARYVKFMSCSNVRDRFDFSDMRHVKIPLPPIDVQQAIVDVYRCANEAKKIAAEADRLSREICPALIQCVAKEVA